GDQRGAGPEDRAPVRGQVLVLEVRTPLGELDDDLREGLPVGVLPVGDVDAAQRDPASGVQTDGVGVPAGPAVRVPVQDLAGPPTVDVRLLAGGSHEAGLAAGV